MRIHLILSIFCLVYILEELCSIFSPMAQLLNPYFLLILAKTSKILCKSSFFISFIFNTLLKFLHFLVKFPSKFLHCIVKKYTFVKKQTKINENVKTKINNNSKKQ